jgi:hypothetical protein
VARYLDRGAGHEGIVGVAHPTATDGNIARGGARSAIGTPATGVVFSFLVSHQGDHQIIVRPSTDQDFTLPNVRRTDGTYDTFAPHEKERVKSVLQKKGVDLRASSPRVRTK